MRFHISWLWVAVRRASAASRTALFLPRHRGRPGRLAGIAFVDRLTAGTGGGASVIVAPPRHGFAAAEWESRVEHGMILVVEGESPLAAAFGFRARATCRHVPVRSVEDLRAPELRIVWEKALDLPVFEIPAEARVFARERWQKAPLVAGLSPRRRRSVMGGRASGPARLRSLPVPAAGARRSRTRTALPLLAPVGVFRFSLPLARRPGLFRRSAGAPPASARCTSRRGISGSAIRKATNTCAA